MSEHFTKLYKISPKHNKARTNKKPPLLCIAAKRMVSGGRPTFDCPNCWNACFAAMCCFYQHVIFVFLFSWVLVQSSQPDQITDTSTTHCNELSAANLPYQTLISYSTRFAYNHALCNGSFYKRNAFPAVPADAHSEPSKLNI